MPEKIRKKWRRPFAWPPSTWEFTAGTQVASDVITGLIFALIVATIICALVIWPVLLYLTVHNVISGTADDVRNTFLAVAALVGVPFLIWRTLISAKQTNISREAHYTALFTKAVEQLGGEKVVKRREFKPEYQKDEQGNRILSKDKKPIPLTTSDGEPVGEYFSYEVTVKNSEVRLGAIYALERIAQDSERDAWPIYQTLCSYIQNNAPPREDLADRAPKSNASEIDEIFYVLGRYSGPRPQDTGSIYFDKLHFENVRLAEKEFRQFFFGHCSFYWITGREIIDSVIFHDCDIGTIQFSEASVTDSGLIDVRAKKLSFHRSTVSRFETGGARISEFQSSASLVKDSDINVPYGTVAIAHCVFENVDLKGSDQPAYYPGRTQMITGNDFRDCAFTDCDFSLIDLSSNLFTRCKFTNCNLVNVKAINGEENEFIHCMGEDDVKLDPNEDPLTQMRRRWIHWKFDYRP